MDNLLPIIIAQFQLPLDSIHALSHWKRVEALGLYISKSTGADTTVVKYFAYLHDSQRNSDGIDIEHGIRAKAFIANLISQRLLVLNRTQEHLLQTACGTHNTTRTLPMDPTVATCLDADRLDLWRLEMQPSEKLLFTVVGKEISKDKLLYDEITRHTSFFDP